MFSQASELLITHSPSSLEEKVFPESTAGELVFFSYSEQAYLRCILVDVPQEQHEALTMVHLSDMSQLVKQHSQKRRSVVELVQIIRGSPAPHSQLDMVSKCLQSFFELQANAVGECSLSPLRMAFAECGVVHVEVVQQRLHVLVKRLQDAGDLVLVEQRNGLPFVVSEVTESCESFREAGRQFVVLQRDEE